MRVKLWLQIRIEIGDSTVLFGSTHIDSKADEDLELFRQFDSLLQEAFERAVLHGIAAWDAFMAQPRVRVVERTILASYSFKHNPILLERVSPEPSSDVERPFDYVLYDDFIWSLDEDLKWGEMDDALLLERLEKETFRLQRSSDGISADALGRVPIPESVRIEVWRRDQGTCARCGSREKLEFDHIVPVSKGGSNTARNVELLCESCNRRKGAAIA